MARPVAIVAIDAGSNAIRAAVARAASPSEIHEIATERWPVRLGHNVFTKRRLAPRTIARAVQTFRHFRATLKRYDVKLYRAVATSAVREAENRDVLRERILKETGIRLEVIDASEEARLVLEAVHGVLGPFAPRLVVDLGGGSLEVTLLRDWKVMKSIALPIGTVRLMESMKLTGVVDEDQFERIHHRVLSLIRSAWPDPPNLSRFPAVFCGGNAEALTRIAPGPRLRGVSSIHVRLLRDRAWEILRRDIPSRMRTFHIRRDRAEVIGIAAVVFLCLAEHAKLETLLVPGVGVREGILCELAAEHFGAPGLNRHRANALLNHARLIADRFQCPMRHAEHVRTIAASLFDQLAPVIELPEEMRLLLEIAALLHDSGKAIHTKGHHKHGEYLVRNVEFPGISDELQAILACLVRYHAKSEPEAHHRLYAELGVRDRRTVRALSSLLRIAVALDAGGTHDIRGIIARKTRKRVRIRLYVTHGAAPNLAELSRRARPFEKEFDVRVKFSRTRAKLGAQNIRADLNRALRNNQRVDFRALYSLTA
ncbi:MAG TPA: Ppx/GppA phosphatase family protein [Candidatus Acidoferrum sp.]|nr:Ppx/GppA phosphatase family protein [Candidatus Acidoferrum sp.]